MKRLLLPLAALLAAGCGPISPDPTRVERDDLAPTGTVRVAVVTDNPVLGRPDPSRGEPAGTTAVLGKALGTHARLPVRLVEYASEGKLVEDAAAGAWDVSAVPCRPERKGLDYVLPHYEVAVGSGPATAICMVVPQGREQGRNFVAGFVLRAKSQGIAARAIEESGLQGVTVTQ